MAVDPARATLVVKEYRYAEAPAPTTGAAIRAKFDNAKLIEIDTNLDQAGAQALANEIAATTSNFVRTFSVPFEDALYPEDFTGGAPRYFLDFPRHASAGPNAHTVVSATIDYFNDLTTVKVRGS